jgi:farnesyl-diphosphate farnesyltransferase
MDYTSPQQIAGSRINPRRGERRGPDVDLSWHENLLAGVSRTFALTIPQLPGGLREAVTNAYLLCRVADTIEDDPFLDPDAKDRFHTQFLQAVTTGRGAHAFASELAPRLAPSTLAAEVELIEESPRVLQITRAMHPRQRQAIHRCLATMSHGMADFARNRDRTGLADVAEYERYCYFVAGVVGEMLTDLFCAYSPEIDANRDELASRAVSFGLGLQMTNILKDIWDDLEHGTCWLPRDVFERHGYDLAGLAPGHSGNGPAFAASMLDLVEIANSHLREALAYTLAIPSKETGIRRFLIWAVLLAVSTLGKISNDPLFTSGTQVKVSRPHVAAIIAGSSTLIRSNDGLTRLFNTAARGLPLDTTDNVPALIRKESPIP